MYPRPQGWTTIVESDQGLRKVILTFIAYFANWDFAANRTYLDVSRALVKAAHGEEPPLVVDPVRGRRLDQRSKANLSRLVKGTSDQLCFFENP